MKKGSFHDVWRLRWQPEFALRVIEAATWGNTVETAAEARAIERITHTNHLSELAGLLQSGLLAGLPAGVEAAITRLRDCAALAADVGELMDAVPPLAAAMRYGTIRRTDAALLRSVASSMLVRVLAGLEASVFGLDDEAAAEMSRRVGELNHAIGLLDEAELISAWRASLQGLLGLERVHGLIAGRICRLLLDAGSIAPSDAASRLGLALSRAVEPAQSASWFEGFLSGSGLVLLANDRLFDVVDSWLASLRPEDFDLLLPLLRRTVSTFAIGERRQIGQRVRLGTPAHAHDEQELDPERVAIIAPVVRMLLGLKA
jgi:hypothetical protein